MISGAHSIIYSTDAHADRSFFRDVLKFPHVDIGDGWLISGLPPAELAVHPAEDNNIHELYLTCDDIVVFSTEMSAHNIPCTKVEELPWGLRVRITLPGGGSLGIYQPRHPRPASVT